LIIGETESSSKQVMVKDLKAGEQKILAQNPEALINQLLLK
jgi:histidyl-tRNA synthetase